MLLNQRAITVCNSSKHGSSHRGKNEVLVDCQRRISTHIIQKRGSPQVVGNPFQHTKSFYKVYLQSLSTKSFCVPFVSLVSLGALKFKIFRRFYTHNKRKNNRKTKKQQKNAQKCYKNYKILKNVPQKAINKLENL